MARKAPEKKKEKEIINKSKLVDKIAQETDGLTKKDIAAVVNAFMSAVVDSVRQGDEVRLVGFGTFKNTHRNARTGRNPQTGEPIEIQPSDAFSFRSSIRF